MLRVSDISAVIRFIAYAESCSSGVLIYLKPEMQRGNEEAGRLTDEEVRVMNLRNCSIFFLLASSTIIASGQTEQMKGRILSQNYDIAEKALEENIKQRDVKAICLSLKHQAQSLKIKAADALGSIRSKEGVDCLIEALKANLASKHAPGYSDSESRALSNELDKSIIHALRVITGLNLPLKNKYPDSEIEKVVKRTSEWQRKHQSR